MKGIILTFIMLMGVSLIIVGYNSVNNADRTAQKEVIDNFYKAFYSYKYSEEEGAFRQNIMHQITPLLSVNNQITSSTINNLVIKPANFSKVSVSYSSYSIEKESKKTIDEIKVHSFVVFVDVIVESDLDGETIKTQEMIINLVEEDDSWKVHNLEYMADDYLFEI